jgi:uncharacterized protein (UPF0147 family)
MLKVIKMSELKPVIEALKELEEDSGIPRNVRNKAREMIDTLSNEKEDFNLRVSKVLEELEELSNDVNLQAFTRTLLWDIISMLGNLE